MKNHWDLTKRQWKYWVKLTGESCLKWDSTTKKFCASGENLAKQTRKLLNFSLRNFSLLTNWKSSLEMEPVTCLKRQNCSLATPVKEEENDFSYDTTAVRRAAKIQCRNGRTIVSEQSMSISSPHNRKAFWALPVHRDFVDLCLEETLKGNKPGTHFTKEGWRNIVAAFGYKTGLRYDRIQLKNHWDGTKEQRKIWHKLVGTSIMKWDPDRSEFGAGEEAWENYLKENPEAAQFRSKELPLADKLDILFDGTIDFGEKVSAIQHMKCNDNLTASTLQTEKPDILQPEGTTDSHRDLVESSGAVTFQKQDGVTVSSTQSKLTFSIGECIDCLDGFEELEQGSGLYLFALDVFLKKEYREIFLQLKRPSVKLSWLQWLQAVDQPLQL
ncbi:Myb/SANT-like domain containing protein [Parasponia andersonii]|uniref:Myb/SANT-like domain containing protein n=1 Tax=Parasponia andersonii TaxID=3476 RepID=A0A2P5AIF1_PARAD|nr:Myb/SANT-like domain containing protein [Parasponia andersonii]